MRRPRASEYACLASVRAYGRAVNAGLAGADPRCYPDNLAHQRKAFMIRIAVVLLFRRRCFVMRAIGLSVVVVHSKSFSISVLLRLIG